MIYEQITARGLLERIHEYPQLELRTRDGWCVVTYISNHNAQNAVVIPTSNQIYVTAVQRLVYRPMDILNIRYEENAPLAIVEDESES